MNIIREPNKCPFYFIRAGLCLVWKLGNRLLLDQPVPRVASLVYIQ